MKCQSCNADIPPCWVNAIKINICPGCGNSIMADEIVDLMKHLAEAITKMEFDAQEITGWILSNYRLEKVGDGEPTGFHRAKPISTNAGGSAIEGTDYSNDKRAKLADFFKRADAPLGVVGMSKADLKRKRKIENEEENEEEDEEGNDLIDVTDDHKDPMFTGLNINEVVSQEDIEAIQAQASRRRPVPAQHAPTQDVENYDAPNIEYSALPPDEKMSPQLRALREKQFDKLEESREAVLSGVRTNKNGFSRGG